MDRSILDVHAKSLKCDDYDAEYFIGYTDISEHEYTDISDVNDFTNWDRDKNGEFTRKELRPEYGLNREYKMAKSKIKFYSRMNQT